MDYRGVTPDFCLIREIRVIRALKGYVSVLPITFFRGNCG